MQNDISPPPQRQAPKELPEAVQASSPAAAASTGLPSKSKTQKLLTAHHGWSRRRKFVVGAAALLVLAAAASFLVWYKTGSGPISTFAPKKTSDPQTPIVSPLSGVEVPADLAKRPVTAVMIENSQVSRPQSGLHDAGIVFEAIAEGGITRYMALFQENNPPYVGPVRSLRPYYLDFARPFEASIVHVGGSPDALRQVRKKGMRDLDQFFNPQAYWRVNSRPSPHNVYTSFARLDALNKAKDYKESHFTPWPRKADSKLAQPTATSIDLNISGALYNVRYGYDVPTNSYYRRVGGQGHVVTVKQNDAKPRQLHPKVVLVLVMPHSVARTGHSNYVTHGSGRLYLFQDGGVEGGFWKKKSAEGQFSFATGDGKPLKLNAGQTWVTIVGDKSRVRYSP